MRVLSIGEVLWDLFPKEERFGGAALNFSANLKRMGHAPVLLSAVGNDTRGRLAIERMHEMGLETRGVCIARTLPTGVAVVTASGDGDHRFKIERPAAFDEVEINAEILEEVTTGSFDWLYYGTLSQTTPSVERMTMLVAESSDGLRCFYDMNLRDGHWNLGLVQRLARASSILKANEAEAKTLHRLEHGNVKEFSLEAFCSEWALQYDLEVICITLGESGCYIYQRGAGHAVPGYPITLCDAVGAGDAFSAAFLHGYGSGRPILRAAQFANAVGAIVASRAGATPLWSLDELAPAFEGLLP